MPQSEGNSGTVIDNYVATNTDSGVATFSDLYVLSSGTFIIQATSTSALTSGQTTSFITKNYIKSFSLVYTGTQELYTSFSVTANIVGDDDFPFVLSATTTLTLTTGVTFTSSNPQTDATGSHVFNMYGTIKGISTVPVEVTDETNTYNDDIDLIFNTPTLVFSVSTSVIFI